VNEQQHQTRLLSAEDIAEMLGIKVQTVYTMARRGELEKVSSVSRQCRAVHRTKGSAQFMTDTTASLLLLVTSVTTLYLALASSVSTCQVG
jgi:hypothetical protein